MHVRIFIPSPSISRESHQKQLEQSGFKNWKVAHHFRVSFLRLSVVNSSFSLPYCLTQSRCLSLSSMIWYALRSCLAAGLSRSEKPSYRPLLIWRGISGTPEFILRQPRLTTNFRISLRRVGTRLGITALRNILVELSSVYQLCAIYYTVRFLLDIGEMFLMVDRAL